MFMPDQGQFGGQPGWGNLWNQMTQGGLNSPLMNLGIGLLSASGQGRSTGEAFGQGLLGMQQAQAYQQQLKRQQMQDKLLQMKMAEMEAAQANREKLQQALSPQMQQYGVTPGSEQEFALFDNPNFTPDAQNPEMGLLTAPDLSDPSKQAEIAGLLAGAGEYGAAAKLAAPNLAAPANVREWQYYSQLPPQEQERYLQMKRANQWLNAGGAYVSPSQSQPGGIQAQIHKTLPPEAQPYVRGEQTRAAEQAKVDVEMPKLRKAATNAMNDLERQTQVVTSNIDKALKLISPWSTGYGSFLSGLPETDAGELKNTLDTIRANVGFDKLQRLRDNSPTGGALGQVSEMENRLLQAVNGALDPKQSDQLKENLTIIRDLYQEVLKEKKSAYQQDFGGASAQGKQKKRMRFNPQTGQLEAAQ